MSGDNVLADPDTMTPVISSSRCDVDYVISDYMEKLGTRLNILETELKYAWRALDLLSQEYVKMWERLEKLEGLLYEQQSVIAQLLDFYTSGEASGQEILKSRLGELEVIREILGNGSVEDGLEEGVDVSRYGGEVIVEELDGGEEINVPDEAFYRSLNQAYRDDLVCCESKLGMIWEEEEEKKADEAQEIYSAMDYKDYRGDSPCVSEQDIAQLTRIGSIDKVAMEKLNELDRLSTKLQQDSMNIKQLQRKLLESPQTTAEAKPEDKWSFSSEFHGNDLLLLQTNNFRPNSRTDNEVAETLGVTPTSPRRSCATCTAPYTTVTGRLAYNTAVEKNESKNPFYCELNSLIAASYETVTSASVVFNVTSEKTMSPTVSVCTRADEDVASSPPPPAPCDIYTNQSYLSSEITPKSPRSPKRSKSHTSNIVTVKSDSGLSSMSGWSSLEKSPESNSKSQMLSYITDINLKHLNSCYVESETDCVVQGTSGLLPGGHHLSAFTTVKSPCSLETTEGYGTFVPAPAPASDINVSPKRRTKVVTSNNSDFLLYTRNEQPAIYSVAGCNKESYTTVYTSNSADYVSQSMNYPDLVEVANRNEPIRNSQQDLSNHDGYKAAMYRTMFPSGNITDALSYYPTSTRLVDVEQARYVEENLESCEQPIYENREMWCNQREEIPYLELDLRNRNVPEYSQGVIVSQSGYITIPATESNNKQKKPFRRVNTLKSAMNTVTHWFPDIHLTKRHRSYSLPSGESFEAKPRKKKKNPLVQTMSGILQKAKKKVNNQQSHSDPEQSENEWVLKRANSLVDEDERSGDSSSIFSEVQPERDLFAKVIKPTNDVEVNVDEDVSCGSGGSSAVFATVGDVKKVTPSTTVAPTEKNTEETFPQVSLGCTSSTEFAVSRALGKYRQRQTTITDDSLEEPVSEETPQEATNDNNKEETIQPTCEGSPATNIKNQLTRYFPRHQQSLEIPGMSRSEDEDNRSTHSVRSLSRVSSRRQSTEDSIDSEDEWYCYELRKLEEMEKHSLFESEINETLVEVPEESIEEPDEEIKERMSYVLRELKMKAKVVEGVLDREDYNREVIASAQRREEVEEEHSSGDTSGPDSPQQSPDEYDEVAEEFARCHNRKESSEIEVVEETSVKVPKIQIEGTKDEAKDAGSKWKLLKALKERKAEEKNNQEKVSDGSSVVDKEKVSMIGMMQKFYEIHVKT